VNHRPCVDQETTRPPGQGLSALKRPPAVRSPPRRVEALLGHIEGAKRRNSTVPAFGVRAGRSGGRTPKRGFETIQGALPAQTRWGIAFQGMGALKMPAQGPGRIPWHCGVAALESVPRKNFGCRGGRPSRKGQPLQFPLGQPAGNRHGGRKPSLEHGVAI